MHDALGLADATRLARHRGCPSCADRRRRHRLDAACRRRGAGGRARGRCHGGRRRRAAARHAAAGAAPAPKARGRCSPRRIAGAKRPPTWVPSSPWPAPTTPAPARRNSSSGTPMVRALLRSLAILECFSLEKPALTLQEIYRKVELPKSTTFRLVITLQNAGYLLQRTDRATRCRTSCCCSAASSARRSTSARSPVRSWRTSRAPPARR